MELIFESVEICRTCKQPSLVEVLNLGSQPLANSLVVSPGSKELLVLLRCESCNLLQLSVNVNPSIMFSNYNWVTGTSALSVDHCRIFASRAIDYIGEKNFSVLEIGSNDGTLLQHLSTYGCKLLVGVDPAANLVKSYRDPLIGEINFFNSQTAIELGEKYSLFDLIIARNVFSHIPDFRDAISGVSHLMHSSSVFIMEFHWVYNILQDNHFDSIYHEHTYYHSISSVIEVLDEFGIVAFDASHSPISGGSIVLLSSKENRSPSLKLAEFQEVEKTSGVNEASLWSTFAIDAQKTLIELGKFLGKEFKNGVCGFGASARSSTLLNALGSQSKKILSIVDNNELKVGYFSPGAGIPIESLTSALKRNPDAFVVFAFNFEEEILQQLSDIGWSGEVFLPLPYPSKTLRIN